MLPRNQGEIEVAFSGIIIFGVHDMHFIDKKNDKGQDLAEYALLIGLIALVVILAVTILGTNISQVFSDLAASVATWL